MLSNSQSQGARSCRSTRVTTVTDGNLGRWMCDDTHYPLSSPNPLLGWNDLKMDSCHQSDISFSQSRRSLNVASSDGFIAEVIHILRRRTKVRVQDTARRQARNPGTPYRSIHLNMEILWAQWVIITRAWIAIFRKILFATCMDVVEVYWIIKKLDGVFYTSWNPASPRILLTPF